MSSFSSDRSRAARAVFVLAWVAFSSSAARAQRVPDEVLVRFKAGVPESAAQRAIDELGARECDSIPEMRVRVLKLPPGLPAEEALARLKKHPRVDVAEPNPIFRAAVPCLPDDLYLSNQWALDAISASAAWDSCIAGSAGASSVIIAVLDTGIIINHEDLPGPKLAAGYNAISPETNTADDDPEGHGTAVAGIAAAETNNAKGMAGAGWNTRLMPVKILDSTGYGTLSHLIKGVLWASSRPGVRVLNMSIASTEEPEDEHVFGAEAMETAHQRGMVLVAAAGNEASDSVAYPAAFPYVLGVSATDSADRLASFSNFGASIDVAAPGVAILAPRADQDFGDLYAQYSGTSMAAPFVSALAAVLFAQDPARTNEEVIGLMERSAEQPEGGAGWNPRFGHGRIDMYRALTGTVRAAPAQSILAYNYPNPFSPDMDRFTTFVVKAQTGDPVEIVIFDGLGNRVWGTSCAAPDDLYYNSPLRWDGKDERGRHLANGVYFARIKVGQSQVLKKIAIVR